MAHRRRVSWMTCRGAGGAAEGGSVSALEKSEDQTVLYSVAFGYGTIENGEQEEGRGGAGGGHGDKLGVWSCSALQPAGAD